MDENNLEYLAAQVKFTGFGEQHQAELRVKMEEQLPTFTIEHETSYGNDHAAASLRFSKSKEMDRYFFNSYEVSLTNGRQQEPLKQTFYINHKESNITLKEAYNLMNGRSVYKELTKRDGQKYHAWVQLDFAKRDANGNFKTKQYHENYGYDLASVLSKYPIKELSNPQDREWFFRSLERGNLQAATVKVSGEEKAVFIEAVPRFKSVNVYDTGQQRLKSDELFASDVRQHPGSQEAKSESKKKSTATDEDVPAGMKKKKARRKKLSVS